MNDTKINPVSKYLGMGVALALAGGVLAMILAGAAFISIALWTMAAEFLRGDPMGLLLIGVGMVALGIGAIVVTARLSKKKEGGDG